MLFYREQLNLSVNFENSWFIEFRLLENSYLSIADAAHATIDGARGKGITITWKVADLLRTQQKLKNKGVATTEIKEKWNAQQFFLHDPEGHRIEIWSE